MLLLSWQGQDPPRHLLTWSFVLKTEKPSVARHLVPQWPVTQPFLLLPDKRPLHPHCYQIELVAVATAQHWRPPVRGPSVVDGSVHPSHVSAHWLRLHAAAGGCWSASLPPLLAVPLSLASPCLRIPCSSKGSMRGGRPPRAWDPSLLLLLRLLLPLLVVTSCRRSTGRPRRSFPTATAPLGRG